MLKFIRISTFLICLLSGPLALAWIFSTGITMFYWYALGVPFVWAILLTLWYLIWGRAPFTKRLKGAGIVFALIILIGFGIAFLTRYEGSSSGASLPKLVWKWSKKEAANSTLTDAPPVRNSEIPLEEVQAAAGNSIRFLGPDSNGVWKEIPFSVDWESHPPQEVWRRTLGYGWSSFAVSGSKAVTLEEIDEVEQLSCIDLYTGDRIWNHSYPGFPSLAETESKSSSEATEEKPGGRMDGKGPRSTPSIHQGRVYAYGSIGILNCCDLDTGKVLWSKNVIEEEKAKMPIWGKSSSPLVLADQNAVIVTVGEGKGTTLAALDLESGETVWRYMGSGSSYSSPVVLTLDDIPQIVSVNAKDVVGLEIATGEELWKFDWPGHYPKVGQPALFMKNRLLITASYGIPSYLIGVEKYEDTWVAKALWETNRMKTKFSSAVILGNHAYGLDEGNLAAIDLASGKKAWKMRGYGFGQQLLVGDHLLIQAEDGDLVFGKASPEGFGEIAKLDALNSMTWNTPTLAGRLLLLRNDREAVCYLLPEKDEQSP